MVYTELVNQICWFEKDLDHYNKELKDTLFILHNNEYLQYKIEILKSIRYP